MFQIDLNFEVQNLTLIVDLCNFMNTWLIEILKYHIQQKFPTNWLIGKKLLLITN